jgi:hypothetical protein
VAFLGYFGLIRAGSFELPGSLGVLAAPMIGFGQQHDRRKGTRTSSFCKGLGTFDLSAALAYRELLR